MYSILIVPLAEIVDSRASSIGLQLPFSSQASHLPWQDILFSLIRNGDSRPKSIVEAKEYRDMQAFSLLLTVLCL